MRSITGAFLAAQQSASQTPFIRLVFTSPDGGTTYDYSTDVVGEDCRLLQLEHHEEPYSDYATLYFTNETNDFPDLRGYWVCIGYGFTVGESSYSSPTSKLWVKRQGYVSAEGEKTVILELEGVWHMMSEQLIRTGDPPFYVRDAENGGYYGYGKTVYWLLNDVLDAMDVEGIYDFVLLALSGEDDGIIDTFLPKFEINTENLFEDATTLVKRLMDMTKCYLRAVALDSGGIFFKVIYPEESDSPDATYYSYQEHCFYEFVGTKSLTIPNHIILFANEGTDGLWTSLITAEAKDEDQIALYRDVTAIYTAALIDNQTDANNRAAAIISKIITESFHGRIVIPMDCGLELYDLVAVEDAR